MEYAEGLSILLCERIANGDEMEWWSGDDDEGSDREMERVLDIVNPGRKRPS